MKKRLLVLCSFLLLLSTIVIYSCRKNDIVSKAEVTSSVPASILDAAKAWHAAELKKGDTGTAEYISKRAKLPPVWKESQLLQLKDGRTYLVVNSPKVRLSEESKASVIRKFIFDLQDNKILNGTIIEIYGLKEAIEKSKANILEKYLNNADMDFTGSVILYTINYKYLGE